CACCSLKALMKTTLRRSYLTPSTSPLLLLNVNNGSTAATCSTPRPTSRVPYCFHVNVIGFRRSIISRPPMYGAKSLLYLWLDPQAAMVNPGAKHTGAVPAGRKPKVILPKTVTSPLIRDVLLNVTPVPANMWLKTTGLLKVAPLLTVIPLVLVNDPV